MNEMIRLNSQVRWNLSSCLTAEQTADSSPLRPDVRIPVSQFPVSRCGRFHLLVCVSCGVLLWLADPLHLFLLVPPVSRCLICVYISGTIQSSLVRSFARCGPDVCLVLVLFALLLLGLWVLDFVFFCVGFLFLADSFLPAASGLNVWCLNSLLIR